MSHRTGSSSPGSAVPRAPFHPGVEVAARRGRAARGDPPRAISGWADPRGCSHDAAAPPPWRGPEPGPPRGCAGRNRRGRSGTRRCVRYRRPRHRRCHRGVVHRGEPANARSRYRARHRHHRNERRCRDPRPERNRDRGPGPNRHGHPGGTRSRPRRNGKRRASHRPYRSGWHSAQCALRARPRGPSRPRNRVRPGPREA